MSNFESVRKFMETFGQEVKKKAEFPNDKITALRYDLITNAKKSIDAGCNLVLYCGGNIRDNYKLIKSLPYIDKFTSEKTSEFYKFLR